jgi:peptidoglycan/xylan/chitin deacetylase (PgdA/CDA1 family)
VKYKDVCYTCNVWEPDPDGYWCGQNDGYFFGDGVASNIDGTNSANKDIWYTETPCDPSAKPSSSSTSGDAGGGDPGDLTTRAGIQAYIDENWQDFGYSEKPQKVIALSFDDGPSAQTQDYLDVLAQKNVKTTFFVIGGNVRDNESAARAIYAAGHELANHSDGWTTGPNQKSLEDCSAAIKKITGSDPILFRAPEFNENGLSGICQNLKLAIINSNCQSSDWDGRGAQQVLSTVQGCASDGAIVNLHEPSGKPLGTLDALPGLIDWLRAQGYWIMPVGQMAIYKEKTLVPGESYPFF